MSDKIVLLDAYTTDLGEPLWHQLGSMGTVERYDRTELDQVLERCRGARFVLTNKCPVSRAVMAAVPELSYIGILATGYNHIDLAAAKEHDIVVSNAPGYSTESVAQLVLASLLHHFSGVHRHDRRVRAGEWATSPDFCFFDGPLEELSGKTLLVVGMGAIGGAVARLAEAFGMRVLAGQVPGRPPAADRIALAEALPEADAISLHCPLTERTSGLVDGSFLNQCKSSAVLVNTGRGPLISDSDLVFALDNGLLAAAYLDVLDQEPPPANHPLIGHERIVVTPHIGWGTAQARQRLAQVVMANLMAFAQGKPQNRVG